HVLGRFEGLLAVRARRQGLVQVRAERPDRELRRRQGSAARTSSAWVSGFTRRITLATLPSPSMTKVERSMPMNVFPSIDFSTHVPYASATDWSSSARSVKGRPYFFLIFVCFCVLSELTTSTTAPRLSHSLPSSP